MTEVKGHTVSVADVRVTITPADGVGVEVPLGLKPIVVGTGAECDLAVKDFGVSRRRDAIGKSLVMRALFHKLGQAAQSPVPVLLIGEPGTGKRILAKAIHQASSRSHGPFVVFNPTNGMSEVPIRGSTLYIDGAEALSRDTQSMLLALALASSSQSDSMHVIAGTHHDLRSRVAAGSFSADLYRWLAGVELLVAQQALTLFRSKGDRYWLHQALFTLGRSLTAIGLVARGEEILREARELAIADGDAHYSTTIHINLGFNLASQPNPPKQEEARSIGEAYREMPHLGQALRGAAHKILAHVLVNAGDLGAAEPVIRISLESFSAYLPYRLSVVALAVELFLKQGRAAEARKLAEEALRLLDEQGGLGACEVPLRLAVTLARFADGDPEGGRSALRDALAQLRLQADGIEDPEMRQSYLALPENRQILDLAQVHGQISFTPGAGSS
jgi:tetratricopeptide (TPR) repeat protein